MLLSKFDLTHIDCNLPIALAVSGGPDSLAMLYMFYEAKLDIVILTVDHKLRPESRREAEYVAAISQKLGLKHYILEWDHPVITNNIHKQAREARYNLMIEWCIENNVHTLCTAHHEDDRFEHLLMKIYRGAGVLGLLDHEVINFGGIKIARPMFHFSKQELIAYLESRNVSYIDDRSNYDPQYLRSNIRKWIQSMPPELDYELFKKRALNTKSNLARAGNVIQKAFDAALSEVELDQFNNKAVIYSLPKDEEVGIMLLSHILPIIGDRENTPRMESMVRLYRSLSSEKNLIKTLSYCIIKKKNNIITILREKRE